MGRGRILKAGEPLQMIREMNGKLWARVVKREEVAEIRARHVLSTRLKAGSTEIRAVRHSARRHATAAPSWKTSTSAR